MYWSFKYLEKGQALLKEMVDNSKGSPLDKDLIQTISGSLNAQPIGIQGVGRSTMALTLVVIVGIGIFYVTLYPIDSDKSPLIKDLMLLCPGPYPQSLDSILEAEQVRIAAQLCRQQPQFRPRQQHLICLR